MALQTSGAISLNDMHIEVGGSSGSQVSLNDTDIRDLIGKSSGAQSSFSEFYGAAAETEVTSEATINGQSNYQELLASDLISADGTLVIPTNFWLWSDSTSTAALTIDVSCTVKNYGKIIGRGGNGDYDAQTNPAPSGGPAIKINSGVSGVTIINYSGAYIAGGGGGGAGDQNNSGGGGGAGGGIGGRPSGSTDGAGGVLNAYGSNGPSGGGGQGGGSGGSGGVNHNGGGGGGRILPGVGGGSVTANFSTSGAGGSAGNAGGAPTDGVASGGGGGWGASGGNPSGGGAGNTGGSGGNAIDDSGVSYTLTNSGTIYGGT